MNLSASRREKGNKARNAAHCCSHRSTFCSHLYLSLSLFNLFLLLLPPFSSAAFRFELPGAPILMAGRLRGGATGANVAAAAAAADAAASAPSTASPSSFLSSFGLKGRRPLQQRVIADVAAAQEEDEDDAYDSESGSESDSESGDEGGGGWRTRSSSSRADEEAKNAQDANFTSYEPKGFEPDLGIRIIKGDGKCMFRALARGMARNKGVVLSPEDETRDADTLRLAEGGIPKYCARLNDAGFWGGEVELMVISRLLRVPIYVYRSSKEAGVEKLVGYGFAPIVKYGEQYAGVSGEGDDGEESRAAGGIGGRKPVNLLYREGNHYDLLVA